MAAACFRRSIKFGIQKSVFCLQFDVIMIKVNTKIILRNDKKLSSVLIAHHDVVRLDIAMKEAMLVKLIQSL